MKCLVATSDARHKTPVVTRDSQNAWAEVDAMNRAARFPAPRARVEGRGVLGLAHASAA
jgi:hypothetical protein